jgi:putative ATPase
MDIFSASRAVNSQKAQPLAARMRPRNLDEFVGQEHIVGKGRLLRRAIEADQLSSLIFYGPPGTGKTTLAQVIAGTTESRFAELSAVTAGVADVRQVIAEAKEHLGLYGKRTVLFIDEIHRFNKSQQDALLPAVEDGTIILVGATTENPYFEVNSALLSRSRIFKLETLTEAEIRLVLERALQDEERGMAKYQPIADTAALDHLAAMSGGDARIALNALELAILTTLPAEDGKRHITLEVASESIQRRAMKYDKNGDYHYDVISAFIKSMRGSDPDATLHWLARMMDAGENPEFIARRIIICAAEDVGLADPQALQVAVTAMQAAHYVGWPEARIPIAMAALYVATAPKSNAAYLGIDAALADMHSKNFTGVPLHLRDAHYKGAKEFGYGLDYQYPHSFPGGWVAQQYLPEELKGTCYYKPTGRGHEKEIMAYLEDKKPKKD